MFFVLRKNLSRLHAHEILRLKNKYEEQLKALEDKVTQLAGSKDTDFRREVEQHAKTLAESYRDKYEESFRDDTYKYKQALRKVTEREKDLEEEMASQRVEITALKSDRQRLSDKISETEKYFDAVKTKLKSGAEKRMNSEAQVNSTSITVASPFPMFYFVYFSVSATSRNPRTQQAAVSESPKAEGGGATHTTCKSPGRSGREGGWNYQN